MVMMPGALSRGGSVVVGGTVVVVVRGTVVVVVRGTVVVVVRGIVVVVVRGTVVVVVVTTAPIGRTAGLTGEYAPTPLAFAAATLNK
jgi:hypothetical protein